MKANDLKTMPIARSVWNPAFTACAGLLAVSAVLITAGKQTGWLRILKAAAPLQRPLDTLPRALGPYRLTLQPRLPAEVEQELGTLDYASWRLEDTSAPSNAAWRSGHLSATYYTGKVDQVPHVPEECLHQAGRQQVGDKIATPMMLASLPRPGHAPIPVRALVFRNAHDTRGLRIYYTFNCNSDFYDDRDGVRGRMADFREKHLYYSKIELEYPVTSLDEQNEELTKAAQRVFDTVLPVLVRDFWPDWKRIEQ